jgi:hypothetical protein
MPYTLDLIRHRDQFRRRGLKPVHNPDANPVIREVDEQYQADDDEGEIDKDERYMPPKDIHEPATKRRKIQEQNVQDDIEPEIRLPHGRRKFLDPSRFDVERNAIPVHASPIRQVPHENTSHF